MIECTIKLKTEKLIIEYSFSQDSEKTEKTEKLLLRSRICSHNHPDSLSTHLSIHLRPNNTAQHDSLESKLSCWCAPTGIPVAPVLMTQHTRRERSRKWSLRLSYFCPEFTHGDQTRWFSDGLSTSTDCLGISKCDPGVIRLAVLSVDLLAVLLRTPRGLRLTFGSFIVKGALCSIEFFIARSLRQTARSILPGKETQRSTSGSITSEI